MSRICLDTSAYSHFKRGDVLATELVETADWIGVPSTTLGELRVGFLLGRQRERNENELRQFLSNTSMPLVFRLFQIPDGCLVNQFIQSAEQFRLPVDDIFPER